jgi:hypothetical protein
VSVSVSVTVVSAGGGDCGVVQARRSRESMGTIRGTGGLFHKRNVAVTEAEVEVCWRRRRGARGLVFSSSLFVRPFHSLLTPGLHEIVFGAGSSGSFYR